MATLMQRLKAMSLKEFRIFQKEVDELAEQKVSEYLRSVWAKYYMLAPTIDQEYAAEPDRVNEAILKYLERCDFSSDTILSEKVSVEDPSYAYSVEYGKIWFCSHDTYHGYTIRGSPEKYVIDLPREYSFSLETEEKYKKIPVEESALYMALIHYRFQTRR